MIISEEIKYEVKYGKPSEVSSFTHLENALDYFNEKVSENKRPTMYKITQKTELEKFNVGVIHERAN
jgi:hypothetical protein